MLSSPRARLVLQGIVIAALASVVYARAIWGPFIWDDRFLIAQIEENSLGQLLSGHFLARPDGSGGDFFRPLTTLLLAVDYVLWDANPLFFHVTNFLLHALGALAVWALARRLVGPLAAFIAACLFAAHPAHCEPVCWISGRADLLCAPLVILAVLAYLRWRDSMMSLVALVPAVLALTAKESAIVFVPLAPLCLWMAGEKRLRQLARPVLLFGALVIVYFVVRRTLAPPSPTVLPPANTFQHAALVTYSLFMHLQIMLLPHTSRLAYQVVTDEIVGAPMLQSLVALGAVAYLAAIRRKDLPVLAFAVLWFAVAMIPASGIVRGATQTIVAQRYVYLASAGLAILLGFAASGKGRRAVRMAAVGIVFVYFAAVSFTHSGYWADDVVFWRRFVRDAPTMGWGYYHLGLSYHERGMEKQARRAYLHAAKLMPGEALPMEGIGRSYLAERRIDEARTIRSAP